MAMRRPPDRKARPHDGWWDNQLKSRYAFKVETGALLVFPGQKICLFKGGWQPTAMEKGGHTRGRWVFTRGGGLLDISRMASEVKTYRRAQANSIASGEPTKAPLNYKCEVWSPWIHTAPPWTSRPWPARASR